MDFRVLKIEEGKHILQYKYWFKWRTVTCKITFKETNKYFEDVKVNITMFFSSVEEAQSFAYKFLQKSTDEGKVVGEFSI